MTAFRPFHNPLPHTHIPQPHAQSPFPDQIPLPPPFPKAVRGGMATGRGFYDYGTDENKLASRVGEKTVCNNDRCQFCDYGADESELATWIAPRRARGVWLKVIAGVRPYPMPLLVRIDGLLGTFKEST